MRRTTLTLLFALLPASCGAAPLGRLFFSPAERAARDEPAQVTTAPSATPDYTVSGMLRSRSGRVLIWVDGQALPPDHGWQVETTARHGIVGALPPPAGWQARPAEAEAEAPVIRILRHAPAAAGSAP